ncbi:MAG: ATP cone domain-containing protein [Candidatus Heimdallarchaeaceae archaeon]
MTDVIKTDGRKEAFDAEKLRRSVEAAVMESDVSEDRRKDVIDRVVRVAREMTENRDEIRTSEIRARILRELDTLEPSISKAWRTYEQTKATKK